MRGRTGEKTGGRTKPTAFLLAVLLLVPLTAFGEASDFVPVIYSTSGDIELNVTSQSEQNTAGGSGTKSSDLFASERLKLLLDGFVYHPRFIVFLAKGAGGLSQERFESTNLGSFNDNSSSTEYEFRTKILPEHPYNLELYTLRATPLFPGLSTANARPTLTEKGALFSYAERPLHVNLGYTEGTTETRVSSSEFKTTRASGSYIISHVQNNAVYSHADTSSSLGTQTAGDSSSFRNTLELGGASLDSSINRKRLEQTSFFSAPLDSDTLGWTEQVNAALPWNFSTSASYNFQKDVLIVEGTASGPRLETTSEARSSDFSLAHKLYDSVRTSYAYNRSSAETSSGDTKSASNALNGVYTKRIPDGRVTIGIQGSRVVIDRENAPLVVGEVHTAPLFGTFTLAREGVDPATISLRAVTDAGALIDLALNTNYIAEPAGNTDVITIMSLPPEITAGRPVGFVYTFQVTYALAPATVEFETTTTGYSANLSFFSNLINPYYNHLHTSQAILSGSIPGGAERTDTDVIGVTVQKRPFLLLSEYRAIDSNIRPGHSLRNGAEYASKASDTLDVSAKIQHTKTVYGSGNLGTSGYTEQVTTFGCMLKKTVPRSNLNASLGATYSRRRSTTDTDLSVITGSLSWQAGTLLVNLGTSLSHATSTGIIERQTVLSEFYYMTVSRKLF